ncbi:MAG: hypothetical protein AAF799_44200 [Myxococcota bacterium]
MSSEDSVQAIIDAAQRFDSPSTAVKTRTWSAVQRRWAAGDHGPPIEPGATTTATATQTGLAKGWMVLAGGLLAGVVALVVVSPGDDEQSPPTVAASTPPASPVETAAPEGPVPAAMPAPAATGGERGAPLESPSSQPTVEATSPESDVARRPSRAAVRRAAVEHSVEPDEVKTTAVDEAEGQGDEPGLEGEVALFGAARRALAEGKPKRALVLLERHHREFPHGTFARERELSRVTALCELGREPSARDVAQRYLAKHPSEALRRRFAGTCIGALD